MTSKKRPDSDTVMKRFWEDNERFADLFNAVFFQGEEVIKPELLEEKNTDVSVSVPVGKHFEHVKKYQDVSKIYKGMELTILGIENQNKIHYAMPLRCRLYDDLDYLKECNALTGIRRQENNWESSDEFLSGIKKGDCLHMSLRIVIYYGEDPWDGPRKLSDMVYVPKAFQPFFQDYEMPLVEIQNPENGNIPYKNESVKALMTQLYLLYNEKWDELKNQSIQLDNDTAQVLAALSGNNYLERFVKKGKEKTNMCRALDNLERTKYNEGKSDGKVEGKIEGKIEGVDLSSRIFKLIKSNPDIANKEITEKCACTEEEVQEVRDKFEI